ncbi:MAG: hypothetical protein AAGJ18_25085 [Bacteroidota bacterium]
MPDYEKITEYEDKEFPELFRELPTLGSQLECPNCASEIFSDDINIDKAIAKCHNCHHVFPFEKKLKKRSRGGKRAEIFQPEGIEMFRLRSELNIDYKWRNTQSSNYFLLFFTLVWNAMILPSAFAAVMSGELVSLLFMSVHIGVGVWLLLSQFSRFINSTYITVDEYYLTIDHRPISSPWFKNKKIPVDAIEQVFVKKERKGSTNGTPNFGYSIIAVDKRGRREIPLIEGMSKPDKALFIEQEIEYFLGIEDRNVKGEVRI